MSDLALGGLSRPNITLRSRQPRQHFVQELGPRMLSVWRGRTYRLHEAGGRILFQDTIELVLSDASIRGEQCGVGNACPMF